MCRLWAHRSRHQTWISTNFIVLTALFIVPIFIAQRIEDLSDWSFKYLSWKVNGIVLLVGAASIAGILVMLLAHAASQEISVISNSIQDILDDFAKKRAYLDRSLFTLGALIGVGV